jgi:hypothetical protein
MEDSMKYLLSETGQCIIFGILFGLVISGFYEILEMVTCG